MREVKFGAPGYILMEDMSRNMPGTLRKIADLGFDGIEITGFFGHEAEEIRDMCSHAGIEPYGCFVSLATLLCEESRPEGGNWRAFASTFDIPGQSPDAVMQYIKKIGCTYVGLLVPNRAIGEGDIERINRASGLAEKHGMKLQYHNHEYEYTNMTNGQYRMDYILENVRREVCFEPDLGWMEIGGYKSENALGKYAERIEVVHLKDYYREAFDTSLPFEFRPTGYGVMNWARLLPLCEKLVKPKWYVTDHDKACQSDIYEELGMSLDFVKKLLRYA